MWLSGRLHPCHNPATREAGPGRKNVCVQRYEGSLSGGLGQANVVRSACHERTARFAVASAHVGTAACLQTRASPWQAAWEWKRGGARQKDPRSLRRGLKVVVSPCFRFTQAWFEDEGTCVQKGLDETQLQNAQTNRIPPVRAASNSPTDLNFWTKQLSVEEQGCLFLACSTNKSRSTRFP